MYELFIIYPPARRVHLGFYPDLATAQRAARAVSTRGTSAVTRIARTREDEPLPDGAVERVSGPEFFGEGDDA